MSECEIIRTHFSAKFESVRIGKHQKWKVSELENVRIENSQNGTFSCKVA